MKTICILLYFKYFFYNYDMTEHGLGLAIIHSNHSTWAMYLSLLFFGLYPSLPSSNDNNYDQFCKCILFHFSPSNFVRAIRPLRSRVHLKVGRNEWKIHSRIIPQYSRACIVSAYVTPRVKFKKKGDKPKLNICINSALQVAMLLLPI